MAKKLDEILVIDVESTCWDGPPPPGEESEIIEVGLCVIDLMTLERIDKQSLLIRPQRSRLSPFCTELTTITEADLERGGSLAEACRILRKDYDAKNRPWASWGDYDRRQFEKVCRASEVGYPFGPTHLNIKNLFAMAAGASHELGLDAAFSRLGWQMEGTHHRGVDDAWNIARILCHLLRIHRHGMRLEQPR